MKTKGRSLGRPFFVWSSQLPAQCVLYLYVVKTLIAGNESQYNRRSNEYENEGVSEHLMVRHSCIREISNGVCP